MAFIRNTVIDASPSGDSVKQAVLDLDTDLTAAFEGLNALQGGLALKINQSEYDQPSGVPRLDSSGKIKAGQLDTLADLPVGAILAFGIETLPTGCNWLECNGAQVAIADYAALYEAVGNAFGLADAGNFRLPDLRGRFPRGWDHGAGQDPDAATRSGGDHVGSTQADGVKQHSHVFTPYAFGDSTGNEAFLGQGRYPGSNANFGTGVNADLNAHETRPRNVAVLFCIKWR